MQHQDAIWSSDRKRLGAISGIPLGGASACPCAQSCEFGARARVPQQSIGYRVGRHFGGMHPTARKRCMPHSLDEDLYRMVKGMAARAIAKQGARCIDPTELLHEAWIKVVGSGVNPAERKVFMAVAVKAMRSVLVDQARRAMTQKRGGGLAQTTLSGVGVMGHDPVSVLALERTLAELGEQQPRMVELIELRVYGGFTMAECSEVMGVSERTLNSDWRFAKAWLQSALAGQ
jgi:RNA polymerase sigma factor (TIGR02999 family)